MLNNHTHTHTHTHAFKSAPHLFNYSFIQQEETKVRIQTVLEHLCGEDCKLEIYQIDNTDEIIVYGDSIEGL